jgi:hypothetical protein
MPSEYYLILLIIIRNLIQAATMVSALSAATATTIGLTCKAFLNMGFCSLQVSGLDVLLAALHSNERKNNGQGILTGKWSVTSCSGI